LRRGDQRLGLLGRGGRQRLHRPGDHGRRRRRPRDPRGRRLPRRPSPPQLRPAVPVAAPRTLHPGAWWLWAIGLAVACSQTTNPLVLLIAAASVTFVVLSRRSSSPWGRAFVLYAVLGGFIIALRIVLHVLVGDKWGEIVVLPLPEIGLPSWAAGIDLLGDVRVEGLLATTFEGMRLAM